MLSLSHSPAPQQSLPLPAWPFSPTWLGSCSWSSPGIMPFPFSLSSLGLSHPSRPRWSLKAFEDPPDWGYPLGPLQTSTPLPFPRPVGTSGLAGGTESESRWPRNEEGWIQCSQLCCMSLPEPEEGEGTGIVGPSWSEERLLEPFTPVGSAWGVRASSLCLSVHSWDACVCVSVRVSHSVE